MFQDQRLVVAGGRYLGRHGHAQARPIWAPPCSARRPRRPRRLSAGGSESARPPMSRFARGVGQKPLADRSIDTGMQISRQTPRSEPKPSRRMRAAARLTANSTGRMTSCRYPMERMPLVKNYLRARPVDRHALDPPRPSGAAETVGTPPSSGRAPIGLPAGRQCDAGCPPCGARSPSASPRSATPARPRRRCGLRTGRSMGQGERISAAPDSAARQVVVKALSMARR